MIQQFAEWFFGPDLWEGGIIIIMILFLVTVCGVLVGLGAKGLQWLEGNK